MPISNEPVVRYNRQLLCCIIKATSVRFLICTSNAAFTVQSVVHFGMGNDFYKLPDDQHLQPAQGAQVGLPSSGLEFSQNDK